MQKCTVYHTGIYESACGVIKDNLVYIQMEDDELCFPEEMFLASEECDGGLIQFETQGKWGFANIYTGEIVIDPVWDYAGPFYRGYAHVALGVKLEIIHSSNYHIAIGGISIHGGKHGYIDTSGNIIIPLEYDYCEDIPYEEYFKVAKRKKWGLINRQNKTVIPLKWHTLDISFFNDLIFCCVEETCELHVGSADRLLAAMCNIEPVPTCNHRDKWGVYDKNLNLIVQPELDEKPYIPKIKYNCGSSEVKYYILRINRKYGVLCNDGRLIANIELFKKDAIALIKSIS